MPKSGSQPTKNYLDYMIILEPNLRFTQNEGLPRDSDDQENSFITQYDHYMKLIGSNPDWTLVDVYKDRQSRQKCLFFVPCEFIARRMYKYENLKNALLHKKISEFAVMLAFSDGRHHRNIQC